MNEKLFAACAVVVAAVALLVAIAPVGNSDLWFHLATGDWILDTGSVPDTDPFSHTTEGRALVVHGWLADVLLAGIRRLAGLGGLRLLMASVVALALGVQGLLLRQQGWSRPLAIALPFLVLVLFADRLRLRPDLFSFLGFPLLILALARWHEHERVLCVPGGLAVLLCALWTNLHPAVLIAPFLAGALWLGHRIQTRLVPDEPDGSLTAGLPFAAAPLLLLATFANPYGPKLYLYALQVGDVGDLVREWRSTFAYFETPSRWGHALAPFVLLGLAIAAWRKENGSDRCLTWLLVGLVAWLYALLNARFLYLLFIPLATCLPVSWRTPRRAHALACAVVAASLVGLLVTRGPFLKLVLDDPTRSQRPGYPVGAASFLNQQPSSLRLWHPMAWGGYLADACGPDTVQTFVDGRIVLYGRPVLEQQLVLEGRVRPGNEKHQARKEELLEEHQVQAIVVRPGTWPRGGKWFRAYVSPTAEVYLHVDRAAEAVLHALRTYREAGAKIPEQGLMGAAEDAIAEFLRSP